MTSESSSRLSSGSASLEIAIVLRLGIFFAVIFLFIRSFTVSSTTVVPSGAVVVFFVHVFSSNITAPHLPPKEAVVVGLTSWLDELASEGPDHFGVGKVCDLTGWLDELASEGPDNLGVGVVCDWSSCDLTGWLDELASEGPDNLDVGKVGVVCDWSSCHFDHCSSDHCQCDMTMDDK